MKKKSSNTTRQRYLSLVAKLYELAAEFTDEELRIMVNNLRKSESPAVAGAINALIQLHDLSATANTNAAKIGLPTSEDRTKDQDNSSSERHRETRWLGSVENLLLDRLVFPSTSDIAKIFPEAIQPQAKESRTRYIKRAVRFLSSLPESEKSAFKSKLAEKLSPHETNNFISSWKTLIKDL